MHKPLFRVAFVDSTKLLWSFKREKEVWNVFCELHGESFASLKPLPVDEMKVVEVLVVTDARLSCHRPTKPLQHSWFIYHRAADAPFDASFDERQPGEQRSD